MAEIYKQYWENEKIKSDTDIHYALTKKTWKEVMKILKNTTSILDIGCWGGTLLYNLAEYCNFNSRLCGLDYSLSNCFATKTLIKREIPIVNGDALELPFHRGSFDFITSTMLIEHLQDTDKFIKDVKRVLKKNGFFLVTSVIKKRKTFYIYKNQTGDYVLDPTHIREYESKDEFLSQFTHNDFEIMFINISRLNFSPIDFILRRLFQIFKNDFFRNLPPKLISLRKITEIPLPAYSIEVILRKV